MDICNGVQQDMQEFHTLLMSSIEDELTRVGYEQLGFLIKFRGREKTKRVFLNTNDGCCKEGHEARIEQEELKVVTLHVPSTNRMLSLNSMVYDKFSKSTETFEMKCSDCCKHTSNCPQTGKCKLQKAVSKTELVSTPDILYIQLLRFKNYQYPKVETKVKPENVLVLPNNDKYKLLSKGNHLGKFINNGHYQAVVKTGTNLMRADDTHVTSTTLGQEITENNYIFVYKKFGTTKPFVPTNKWEEVLEDQQIPPGLKIQLDKKSGMKYAKLHDSPKSSRIQNQKQKSVDKTKSEVSEYERKENTSQKVLVVDKMNSKNGKRMETNGNKGKKIAEQVSKKCIKRKGSDGDDSKFLDSGDELPKKKQAKTNPENIKREKGFKSSKLDILNVEEMSKSPVDKLPKPKEMPNSYFSCLEGNNWLNDDVISDYLELVGALDENVFIFTSHFHTAFREGGFRRVKNYYRKYELLEYKQLLIPVHKDSHWFLISFNGTTLEAYDPYNYPRSSSSEKKRLLQLNKKKLEKMLMQLEENYFKPLYKMKNKQFKSLTLRVNLPLDIPAQNNSCDCGVFLVTFIKYLVVKMEFDFDTDSMKEIRELMKTELENKKLELVDEKQGRNDAMEVEELNLIDERQEDGKMESGVLGDERLNLVEQVQMEVEDLGLLSMPINGDTQILDDSFNRIRENDETVQCFMFNNFGLEIVVETLGKKVTCISCMEMFGRIDLHWKKSLECVKAIEMENFNIAYNEHKKERSRLKKKMNNKKYAHEQRLKDENQWKEKERKRKKLYTEKLRMEDEELVKEMERERKKLYREKVRMED